MGINDNEKDYEISPHRHKATLRPRLFEAVQEQSEFGEGTPVAIYIRVSSEQQVDGYSLAAQERKCRELAQRRKWDVVEVYRDAGFSAKNTDRPAFQRMLADASNHRFQSIIVHKLDRFSRSVVDVNKIIKDLYALGIVFTSVSEDFDFTVPSGRLHFHIMAVFSDWFLQNLSAEAVKAKEQMNLQGKHNGMLPFGYVKDEEKNIPVIVPEEAHILQQVFDLYCTGQYGDQQLADFINEAGFKTRQGRRWGKSSVRGVIRNEFYCGKVAHRDKIRPGIHEAIITEEQYKLVMRVREKKNQTLRFNKASRAAQRETDSVARNFALQRIAYCDTCGLTLRVRANRKHRYYTDTARERGFFCDAKAKSIRIDYAETLIREFLSQIKIPFNWQRLISEIAKEQDTILLQTKEKENLEKRIKRATELFLDGYLTREEFDIQQAQYDTLLRNIEIPEEGSVCLTQLVFDCLAQYMDDINQAELSEICHLFFEKVIFNLGRKEIVALEVRPGFPCLLRESLDDHVWKEEEGGYFVRISSGYTVKK